MKLYAPISYWILTPDEKQEICNGCGAKNGINVPDTMWGLSVTDICDIHDYMFKIGKTYGDFLFANAIFIFNLSVKIIANSNWFMTTLRMVRATEYFIAVMKMGESAYWVDKKKNNNYNITFKGVIQ